MARYLIGVDFRSGPDDTPMSEWEPAEVQAHLDHYGALNDELDGLGRARRGDDPHRPRPRQDRDERRGRARS